MKIVSVTAKGQRRAFDVEVPGTRYSFPYAKCTPRPAATDPVVAAYVDPELGHEAFSYRLRSGQEGSVHVDQVREANKDPSYLRDAVLYQLTVEAQKRVAASPLSKREIIRRLGTSAAQFYRLLDQTNYAKSVDQVLHLLAVLDCDVQFMVLPQTA